MFRRNGKNPFEDVQTLYEEESSSNYSPYPRSDLLESSPNLFDSTSKTIETRPLSSYTHEDTQQQWPSTPPFTDLDFAEKPETTLGEGVIFKGELAFERLLRIDGIFEGILVSNGKIIIGPTGSVKADIQLQEAIIEGNVEGNITVSGKVELRGGAVVKGDIHAGTLCVDEGVKLLGFVAVAGINASPEETGS